MSLLDFGGENVALDELSDEELLSLSVSKPRAFEVLVERYEEAFLRKAKNVLRGKEDSEDVVQEVFTKIYLNASKFKEQEGASFKSWGYKILLNTSFTHYQKLKRRRQNTLELSDEMTKFVEDPSSAMALEKKELADYIARAMTSLPKTLSRVLHLHFIERRPQKEIAKMEGITIGAVKTRVYRAKKEFQKITNYNLV